MPTALNWSSGKGVTVQNTTFSDFDNSDNCLGSIPIEFDKDDKRDGHFNYVSSFNNVYYSC